MYTAIIKFSDTLVRSLFILGVLYTLPLKASGQFGLILTLIAFFSFASGFERYVDLQRTMIGKTKKEIDQKIFSAMRFFAANYLIWTPILALLLYKWIELSAIAVVLCLIIAIVEHLSNEFYRIVLITNKYRELLIIAMIKNLSLFGIASYHIFISKISFSIDDILIMWASLSIIALLISLGLVVKSFSPIHEIKISVFTPLFQQFRNSSTHFKIGLMAILTLQADRLIAGNLLPFEDSGIYFRHIFLATSVYQVLGIVSFNRVMASVYSNLRNNNFKQARTLIRRERVIYLTFSIVIIILSFIVKTLPSRDIPVVQNINLVYFCLLVFTYMIRGIADFNAMALNAFYTEKKVFIAHLFTLGLSLPLSFVLTTKFGIIGLVITGLVAANVYLLITHFFSSEAYKKRISGVSGET
jgi:hypothetical protein